MRKVDIYIGTTLHGPAKGTGKGMYIMQSRMQDGQVYEKKAAVEIGDSTEGKLVLYCLRDSLARFHYACDVAVYTECAYVASAIKCRWPETWRENGWMNGKGKKVKDPWLWMDILGQLEDAGHVLVAVSGKHEYSSWMRLNLPKLYAPRDVFGEVDEDALNLVSCWIGWDSSQG